MVSACQIVECMGWEGPVPSAGPAQHRALDICSLLEGKGRREGEKRDSRGGEGRAGEGKEREAGGRGGGKWREERTPLSQEVSPSGHTNNLTSLEMQLRRKLLFVG